MVGVTKPNFGGLAPFVPDFWTPMMAGLPLAQAYGGVADRVFLRVAGRVADGVTIAQAGQSLLSTATHLFPDKKIKRISLTPCSIDRPFQKDLRTASLAVFAAFWLVLLIACANVGNLLVARAAARQKEIALRLSLGASRARLVRQLLTESVLLALAGGALGLLFSSWAGAWMMRRVLAALPPSFDLRFPELTLDLNVFLYALLISLTAGLAFGLLPARTAARRDLAAAVYGDASLLPRLRLPAYP